ncbi:hypothetical protein [Thermostichus vulcanus]|uniref:Uncharacterized protein n=1 Tax=Thermostichus vulcanus str. 'Rupite' TaxID=2813851 RepID=A0ABT0CFT0_THEVL|nr:hypothetical protein [Thermostichus vulcanus]MCJ2544225.1 hypothetical protein [Thermostichus vulcanus str. 'Rupite']
MGVIYTHWAELGGLSNQQIIPAVERLIHQTAQNPNVKYASFDRVFHKFPSYYRRGAIAFALAFNAEAIVFESLKGWKATGGRKRSTLRQRFQGWLKSMIRDYSEMKWQEAGGKTIDVIAAHTSKLAYDGSGVVERDCKNYALAKFASGKRYAADLMALTISLPEGFLSSRAERRVRGIWAKVPDTRLEAGLVCVTCGLIRELQVSTDTTTSCQQVV